MRIDYPEDVNLENATFASLRRTTPLNNSMIGGNLYHYVKSIAATLYQSQFKQDRIERHPDATELSHENPALVRINDNQKVSSLNTRIANAMVTTEFPDGIEITGENALAWIYEYFGTLNTARATWLKMTVEPFPVTTKERKKLQEAVVGCFASMSNDKLTPRGDNKEYFMTALEQAFVYCPVYILLEKFDNELSDDKIDRIARYFGIDNLKTLNDMNYWDEFSSGTDLFEYVTADRNHTTISKTSEFYECMNVKVSKHYLYEGIMSAVSGAVKDALVLESKSKLGESDAISRILEHVKDITPITSTLRQQRQIIHAEQMVYDEENPETFMNYAERLVKTVQDSSIRSEPTQYFKTLHSTLSENFKDIDTMTSKLTNGPIKDLKSTQIFLGQLNAWIKKEKSKNGKNKSSKPTNSSDLVHESDDTNPNPSAGKAHQERKSISAVFKPSKGKEAFHLEQDAVSIIRDINKLLREKHNFPSEPGYSHLVLQKMFGYHIMNNWKNGGRICMICAQHTHDENMKDCRHPWENCPYRERNNIPLNVDAGRGYVEGTLEYYSNQGEGQLLKRAAKDHPDQPLGKKGKSSQPKKKGGANNKKMTQKKNNS